MASTFDNPGTARWRPWRLAAWSVAAFLLLLPWVAMQFTTEVDWTFSDFAIIAAMLALGCVAFEVAARFARDFAYLAGAAIAVATGFGLVWVNLAVGIFQGGDEASNILFVGVVLVAIFGAAIARMHARGLVVAMVATAFAQGLVSVYGLALGMEHPWQLGLIFVVLWLGCAGLFHASVQARAGR